MSVLDNVAYGLKQRKVGKQERYAPGRPRRSSSCGSPAREQAKPAQLSGGMQQRVALARALVMNPKVLLLDEPLGALDLKLRKAMQVELKRIQRDVGITFIVVTHDQEEAMAMADRIAVMDAGPHRPARRPLRDLRPPRHAVRRRLHRRHEPPRGHARARRPSSSSAAVGDARFGIGRVVREAQAGERVRIGLRPEEVHAEHPRRGRARPRCQTAMVLGHHLQIVAVLETGEEIVARQRRTGDEGLERHRPRRQALARLEPDRRAAARSRERRERPRARPSPLEVQA